MSSCIHATQSIVYLSLLLSKVVLIITVLIPKWERLDEVLFKENYILQLILLVCICISALHDAVSCMIFAKYACSAYENEENTPFVVIIGLLILYITPLVVASWFARGMIKDILTPVQYDSALWLIGTYVFTTIVRIATEFIGYRYSIRYLNVVADYEYSIESYI
jgi:hypothetical protein